jgi:phosphatidylinositol alpha-mannosyltransferase
MKIALVSPFDFSAPGGVTEHISRLREEFLRLGHEVRIIAPSSKPVDESKVVVVGKRLFSASSGGSIARVDASFWLFPFYYYPKLRRIMEKEKFDVVHVHEPATPLLPWAAIHAAPGIRVGTFHAYHGENSKAYHIFGPLLSRILCNLDGRIAVSEKAKDFVHRYFPASYRIIPNGVDLGRFNDGATPLPRFSNGGKNILFVGRLEERKGLEYLLRAYKIVKQKRPDVKLIVVGSGDVSPYRKDTSEGVLFEGYVPDSELPRYYRSCDVFCVPSTWGESFGMVLLEAMAMGKPVVASNIEGYKDVLEQDREGILVPPKDEESLASSLLLLMENEGLRSEMGERGRKKAQGYNWNKIARRVMDYYLELLEGKR